MKQNLTKILAETSKVSCFAALLLCAGSVQAGEPKYKVDASTFQCITKMTPVKHFFVDNLAAIWRAPSMSPRREKDNSLRQPCCS